MLISYAIAICTHTRAWDRTYKFNKKKERKKDTKHVPYTQNFWIRIRDWLKLERIEQTNAEPEGYTNSYQIEHFLRNYSHIMMTAD